MAIQWSRGQNNGIGGNQNGVQHYDYFIFSILGDGSSKILNIDLSKKPLSLEIDENNPITGAIVSSYAGTGTVTANISGTVLTLTFSSAPPATILGSGLQGYLLYEG